MKAFDRSLLLETLKGVDFLGKSSAVSFAVIALIGSLFSEQDRKLSELNPALNASYELAEEQRCLKGTRTALLRKIWNFLRYVDALDPDERDALSKSMPKLFWLCGMAGSGKSSVANSIAEATRNDEEFDLTCFFCKRDDPSLSNPKRLFPTLAYRISQYYASYRAALFDLLCSPDAAVLAARDIDIKTQYDMLLGSLLSKVTETPRTHVVIIDALDECGSSNDQKILAKYILCLAKASPWIKVFVTSRPELGIYNALTTSDESSMTSNINEDVETTDDIRLFVEMRLHRVGLSLDSNDIDQLVQRAAGLFIWCSTLFKYLETSRNPRRDLRYFLSGTAKQEPLAQLYVLYDQILKSAVDMGHQQDVHVLHAILGIIYVSASNRPLSAEAMSCFLRCDERYVDEDGDAVRNMARALHAVVYEDASTAIRVCHPSFLDYLERALEERRLSIVTQEVH